MGIYEPYVIVLLAGIVLLLMVKLGWLGFPKKTLTVTFPDNDATLENVRLLMERLNVQTEQEVLTKAVTLLVIGTVMQDSGGTVVAKYSDGTERQITIN